MMQGNTSSAGKVMPNFNTATIKTVMKESLHRIAYNLANSNTSQGMAPGSIVYYKVSPWKVA